MITFCTLFDSNYLDKGLVLYDSLKHTASQMHIYILAMDDRCADILKALNLTNATIISLEAFEDEELKEIKKKRTRAEYCWTCTASLIDYVFEKYREEYCTYVDADLYFYSDPQILIEEMNKNNCSVQIVKHGFGYGKRARKKEKQAGKYCVQFNTFKNDKSGREVLRVWRDQCRAHCSMAPGELGDQKYLDNWAEQYAQVHVLTHPGGGIAPWNLKRYKYVDGKNEVPCLMDKRSKEVFEIVFYHFHHLEYLSAAQVDINVFKLDLGIDKKLVKQLYFPYLEALEKKKQALDEQFHFIPIIHKHPGLVIVKNRNLWKLIKKGELLSRIGNKLIYCWGKRKDIISLDVLSQNSENGGHKK